jgi:hypothetical protein
MMRGERDLVDFLKNKMLIYILREIWDKLIWLYIVKSIEYSSTLFKLQRSEFREFYIFEGEKLLLQRNVFILNIILLTSITCQFGIYNQKFSKCVSFMLSVSGVTIGVPNWDISIGLNGDAHSVIWILTVMYWLLLKL